MYTKIYKGYEIFFTYAYDAYAVRPVGSTETRDMPLFEDQAACKKYADEHPLEMDVEHDIIEEIQKNGRAVKVEFNVYMKEKPLRPMHTTIHAKTETELLHKVAVYLGVKHRLPAEKPFFPED